MARRGKVTQECGDLLAAESRGRTLAVEVIEAHHPTQVRFLRAGTEVAETHDRAGLVAEPGRVVGHREPIGTGLRVARPQVTSPSPTVGTSG